MPSVAVQRSFTTTGKLASSPSRKWSGCSPRGKVLFGQRYSQIADFFMICRVDSSSFILIANRPVLFYCFISPYVCHDQSLNLVHGGTLCLSWPVSEPGSWGDPMFVMTSLWTWFMGDPMFVMTSLWTWFMGGPYVCHDQSLSLVDGRRHCWNL